MILTPLVPKRCEIFPDMPDEAQTVMKRPARMAAVLL
jgi:hypothetical protein